MRSFGIPAAVVPLLGLCLVWGLAASPAYGDFRFGEAANMGPAINTAGGEGAMTLSLDGLELYFGRSDNRLWLARRATVNSKWGRASSLGQLVKDSTYNGDPWMSSDGLRLYFTSDGDGGAGDLDLWVMARASTKDNWGIPVDLGPTVNTSFQEFGPSLSADELELYFTSDRQGGYSLWVATRATKDARWGTPVSLPSAINTTDWNCWPCLSADGLSLYFGSNRAGPFDIYVATRATRNDPWTSPTRLGSPVMGSYVEAYPVISPDGTMFYFSSNRPGGYGSYDLWQVPIVPVLDLNGDGSVDAADMALLVANLGKTNPRCDIAPLPCGDGLVDDKDLAVLTEAMMTPGEQASDVPHDVILGWGAGGSGRVWDVYLGPSFEDVNRADRDHPLGVLASQGQAEAQYRPKGGLEFGGTYYWRVDEVNAADPRDIRRRTVRSFTIEPYGYPVKPVKATASSSMAATMGPEKTIDGSGLDDLDQHSTSASQMWVSKKGLSPIWIQYEFDSVYKLHEMWVWNSNQQVEQTVGFGAKDVAVETSVDGATWKGLANVPEFSQATGEPNYVHNTTVGFDGALARFVKLTINSNWAGSTKQASLSEVRFFYVPVKAFRPWPASGASGVAFDAVLGWRPGREAIRHEVYLGIDLNSMASGASLVKTTSDHSLRLASLGLEYGRTYTWKVNEINETATPRVWEGDLWTFTTPEYSVVEDFESYNDQCDRIFFGWIDGFGYSESDECGVTASAGNGSGSTVGNAAPPFAECKVVHGGRQSMPLAYDNTSEQTISETTRTFEPARDWTCGGPKSLVLWFCGAPDNGPGQLYVKVNGQRLDHPAGNAAVLSGAWTQWNIDLAPVNTDLMAVKTLSIGVSGSGKGIVYIDDLRLYRVTPAVTKPVDPGTHGLEAWYKMEGDVKDSSGQGYHGTAMNHPGYADSMPGFGKALQFGGTDEHVDLPIGPLISTLSGATFSVWVNWSGQGGNWQRIFDFGSGTGSYVYLTPSGASTLSGPLHLEITVGSAGGASVLSAPTALPTGWHPVAVAIDGTSKTAQIWLDGIVVASGAIQILPKDLGVTTQNWLGRSQWPADAYYEGMMDEFRIYSRALSEAEIRYLAGDR